MPVSDCGTHQQSASRISTDDYDAELVCRNVLVLGYGQMTLSVDRLVACEVCELLA